ncbi:MAG: flagellar biosynthesis anti-sigma factor FlgM [Syntrophomonadaceae bacterium]
MKIDGFPGNIAKIYQTNQVKADGAVKRNPLDLNVPDNVEITDQAQRIHTLVKETNALPELREEKIAKIKAEIDSGLYNVSPEKVAAKMLAASKE